MKKTKKTKTKTNFPMSQRHEIWTLAQKWMTMNENVKKEGEIEKNERKMKKTKRTKTKNKITNQQSLNKLFNNRPL